MISSIVTHSKIAFIGNMAWFQFAARILDLIHRILGVIYEYLAYYMIESANFHDDYWAKSLSFREPAEYTRSECKICPIRAQVPADCNWTGCCTTPFSSINWKNRKNLAIQLIAFNVERYLKWQLTQFVTPPVFAFGAHNFTRGSSQQIILRLFFEQAWF